MGCSQSSKSSEASDRNANTNRPNIFKFEEKECIANVWENLRESSADSGLYLLQHFFFLYPEEINKFPFTKDRFGNRNPNYLTGEALRQHSIKVMDALDSVIVDMLQGKDVHKQLVDVGYQHLRMGIEPGEINKLMTAIYDGLKEKEKKKDTDRVMLAWKKLLDVLAEGFEEGLKAARDEANS